MVCVPATCPLLGVAIPAAAVPHSTFSLVELLPWGPPQLWRGDSKAWQEKFNPAETPGSIAKAWDMAVGSVGRGPWEEGQPGCVGDSRKVTGADAIPNARRQAGCLRPRDQPAKNNVTASFSQSLFA